MSDRYEALGLPYPDPETTCTGQCEGVGWVPVHDSDGEEPFRSLADEVHQRACFRVRRRRWYSRPTDTVTVMECDGWHFVRCPDCHGTGKNNLREARALAAARGKQNDG